MDNIPERCPNCGAVLQRHPYHNYPLRRNGWYRYGHGRRWHPEHGWAMQTASCQLAAAKKRIAALEKVAEAARIAVEEDDAEGSAFSTIPNLAEALAALDQKGESHAKESENGVA